MRSLVMSLFARDLIVNYIRYLQCLNLVNNYLHEYSIYTAPQWFLDDRTSILVLLEIIDFERSGSGRFQFIIQRISLQGVSRYYL